jgi:hypothetical protein
MFVAFDAAAETAVVTLAEGGARVLRGATWYKLVTGARIEESDIVEAFDRSQIQIEFSAGPRANLVGSAKMYLVPATAKASPRGSECTERPSRLAESCCNRAGPCACGPPHSI